MPEAEYDIRITVPGYLEPIRLVNNEHDKLQVVAPSWLPMAEYDELGELASELSEVFAEGLQDFYKTLLGRLNQRIILHRLNLPLKNPQVVVGGFEMSHSVRFDSEAPRYLSYDIMPAYSAPGDEEDPDPRGHTDFAADVWTLVDRMVASQPIHLLESLPIFWTLYGRLAPDDVEALGDYTRRSKAIEAYTAITGLVPAVTTEGYALVNLSSGHEFWSQQNPASDCNRTTHPVHPAGDSPGTPE